MTVASFDSSALAKAAWDTFRQALRLVEVTPQLEEDAGDLAERHALSGFDAIHLASALTLTGLPIIIATWDLRLRRATRSAGLGSLLRRAVRVTTRDGVQLGGNDDLQPGRLHLTVCNDIVVDTVMDLERAR